MKIDYSFFLGLYNGYSLNANLSLLSGVSLEKQQQSLHLCIQYSIEGM